MIVVEGQVERVRNRTSMFNLFDSYKGISIDNSGLVVLNRLEFNERLYLILDEAIVKDNLKLLSKEQYKLIMRLFSQADTGLVDDDLVQLDVYLGSILPQEEEN